MEKLISDIPIWWLIVWAIISFAFTFWYYQRKKWLKEVTNVLRFTLVGLRFLGLFIIGILLFGILFQSNEYKTEKPIFINIVDGSSSMLNYADSSSVKEAILAYENNLQETYGDNFEIINYTANDNVVSNYDSLSFKDEETNLAQVFEDVYNKYYNRNVGGISFFSDGNFNKGGNPVYVAEKIQLTPIFTVGIGDTVVKTDQLIQNVLANDIAFLGNQFPIEVDVEANKLAKQKSIVTLYSKGKKISSKAIQFSDESYDIQHLQFLVDAKTIGYNSYTVKVEALDGEYNYENNSRTIYVEVLDSRSKVLITSSAPHPDLGAIKNVLVGDKNLEVEAKLIKDLPDNLTQYDLIIWHQPGIAKNKAVVEKIVNSGKPIWFFVGPRTSAGIVNQLPVSLTIQNTNQIDNVQAYLNEGFTSFEVSNELKKALEYFPPVQAKYGKMATGTNVNTFLSQRLGNVKKKEPLFYFVEQSNKKYAVTYAEGIWRWKFAEFGKTQKNVAFNELITKTAQYLVVRNDASNLRVNLPQNITTVSNIQISAEFYNDNLELITTPSISFVLTDASKNETKFDFVATRKQYLLQLGKLPAGSYTWKATANANGKKFTKAGYLIVKSIEVESLDTRANHNLLFKIADNSNGKFYTVNQTDQLLKDISERKDIAPVKYESQKYLDLIDLKWLFFLLILIFGLEWFLRRYNGAY